ncbi:hypothetical protein JCM3765_004716 [Sporobolomyces pararoseus]
MLSNFLAVTFLSTLATRSFAIPLQVETREPHPIIPCFPYVPDEHTIAIAPTADSNYAWTIFENEDLTIKNVTFRNAHDIYEGVNYNNNYVISQVRNETNEFRFTSAVVNEEQYCIAGVSTTEIRDAPCESPLSTWNLNCFSCGVDGTDAVQCFIRSNAFGTCAQTQEDGSIGLTACYTFENDPQTIEPGNQAWDIL